MKEMNIVWNKVTTHSRFWAILLFIGVLPASAFYAGQRVERLKNEQSQLYQFSQQTMFQSERGMCRISDCTIQELVGNKKVDSIQVTSPKSGEKVSPKSPLKVTWNISSGFSYAQVSVLLLDSKGKSASKVVKVKSSAGSAIVALPAKLSKDPYTVLIQGVAASSTISNIPFAYSGEFNL